MARYVFDIEANGLIPGEIVTIHCLHLKDIDTGKVYRHRKNATENTLELGVVMLQEADLIIGHNVIKYDIPVIQQFFPWFQPKSVFDTIVGTRLCYPDLKKRDFGADRKDFPANMIGKHSLEAWGQRLGNYKGDFKGPWETWTQEMDDYCVQDCEVTLSLLKFLQTNKWCAAFSSESFVLEMEVQKIIYRQERHGVLFNQQAAAELYAKLVQRKNELTEQLKAIFPPWEKKTEFIPKVNNKKRGYVKGVPAFKVKVIEFNPGSRDHIARALKEKHGWVPREYTDDGKPKVDEEVLSKLKFPEASIFSEYLLVEKRIGQLAEGKQAWMKLVQKDGRIHGGVVTNGAVTGRMTHKAPNMAQVPAVRSPYGTECRSLFYVPKGKKLVGADASGLEVRCLGHYMALWDKGEYVNIILNGDIHTANQKAAGIDTRDNAKTFFYAFIYGAGDSKLGSFWKKGREKGAAVRRQFLQGLPALAGLVKLVKKKAKTVGHLKGLDGRLLYVRSQHAALNTALQSAGAVIMKKALVILDEDLQAAGMIPGVNYEFCLNVHDEWQIEVDEDRAEFVGKTAVDAIRKAGEHFKFRCPLTGEYRIGGDWAATH
jgi:DNA polymerase-1